MAALDWLMAADLSTAQCEALEEAYSCLKGGGLRHAKDAESWLSWLLDSCQDKSSASARVAALHLLAQTIPRCSVSAGAEASSHVSSSAGTDWSLSGSE